MLLCPAPRNGAKFSRAVVEITQDCTNDCLQYEPAAIAVLQEAIESYAVQLFVDANTLVKARNNPPDAQKALYGGAVTKADLCALWQHYR